MTVTVETEWHSLLHSSPLTGRGLLYSSAVVQLPLLRPLPRRMEPQHRCRSGFMKLYCSSLGCLCEPEPFFDRPL
jgi:hypothetical protein